MFNKQLFIDNLETQWLGKESLFLDEVDSTQYYAKNLTQQEIINGLVIGAEIQTAGHGQFKRHWNSIKGRNLMFTSVFTPKKADRFTVLTIACALAVYDVLELYIPDNKIHIKWPNDVMVGGKKIAGILTETAFIGNKLDRIAVGIGINVNQAQYPQTLKKNATSMLIESGLEIKREELLAELLVYIEENYERWLNKDIGFIKEINQRIDGYGQWVNLKVNDTLLDGKYKFLGLNENGDFHVLNEDYEVDIFTHEQVRIKTIK